MLKKCLCAVILFAATIIASADNEKSIFPVKKLQIPCSGRLSAGIYKDDVLVRTLLEGEKVKSGEKQIDWNLKDNSGKVVPAGKYELRAVMNNISCEWKCSIGNTGNPPWGNSKILAGLFNTVVIRGDRMLVASSTGEFGKLVQMLDHNRQVIWTADIIPTHGRITGGGVDDKYVYIVIAQDIKRDSFDRMLFEDVIWRIDAATGKTVRWPGKKDLLPVSGTRYSGIEQNIFTRFIKNNEPYPGWNINNVGCKNGMIYLPLYREGVVKVIDRENGKEKTTIPIPYPKFLTVAPDGTLWILAQNRVCKLVSSETGQFVFYSIRITGLKNAWGIAVDKENKIYVSMPGSQNQVSVFDTNGNFIKKYGGICEPNKNTGNLDKLFLPLSLSIGADTLAVADYGNGRIAEFDLANGKFKNSVQAFGLGGIDGSVKFLGDPRLIITQNILVNRQPQTNLTIYKTEIPQKSKWQVKARYPYINPVLSSEPMEYFFNKGKTFICIMGRYPTWYELKKDGKLVFLGALMHPQNYFLRGAFKENILSSFRKHGLISAQGDYPSCRFSWIDSNKDMKVQESEIIRDNSTAPFFTFNDAMVDSDGNMYMYDYISMKLCKFNVQTDNSGKPFYTWQDSKTLIDLSDYHRTKGKDWRAYGKKVDNEGSMYFSMQQGNSCMPLNLNIAKFSKNGKLLWEVGRKAEGLKDSPGEFSAVTAFLGIIDNILYILEYEGMVDLYTTDGLYLATLLDGYTGKEGPYRNYGENFHGDVVKDKNGEIYFMINCHNYVVPVFQVKNLKSLHRFNEIFTVDEKSVEAAKTWKNADAPTQSPYGMQYIFEVAEKTIKNPSQISWGKIPGESISFRPATGPVKKATLKAACNNKFLFVNIEIEDDSPAVNKCTNKNILWDGDCLEMYISGSWRKYDTGGNKGWREYDKIVHIAPFKKNSLKISLFSLNNNWKVDDITEICEKNIQMSEDSYSMCFAIPWDSLKIQPSFMKLIGWDWDVCYSLGDEGKFGYKVKWFPKGFTLRLRQDWDYARIIRDKSDINTAYSEYLHSPGENALDSLSPYMIKPFFEDNYSAYMTTWHDGSNIFFKIEVNDPDPALNTASAAFFYGTGDFIDIVIDGKTFNIPVGIRKEKYLYEIISGSHVRKLQQTSFKLSLKDKAYVVEASIPLSLIGNKKIFDFNWMVSFSDKSGGAVFRQQYWRKEAGKLQLCK